MTDRLRDLICMYDRPMEPVFMPKGPEGKVFDVPEDYIADRYRPLRNDLVNRFGGSSEKIQVKKIRLPDLSGPLKLGRRDTFTLFLPEHRKMAGRLIEVFMGMRSLDDFVSALAFCRDRMNPYLFNYALSVAILHRPDTKNLRIPSLCEVLPDKFVEGGVFKRAREETNIVADEKKRLPLEIPRDYTATDLDEEHRVAYFREDLGVNLHHWHWHLVYPNEGPRNIVAKDRRGELFYYMHQQVMARYNFERFCNDLGRVKRLNNLFDPIPEGYFPKLDSTIASRKYAPRFQNVLLKDVDREVKFDLQDLNRWRDRIYSAIHSGSVLNNRDQSELLTEETGIDVLGNMVEASILSPNKNFYGDLHNFGHLAIAYCHDPDQRNLETNAVMGDTTTAMRDPVFYRWHAFIDDIFQEYKNGLRLYNDDELNFRGVKINSVEVTSPSQNKNRFATFWQQSDVDMSRGVDFTPRGSVLVRFTHLQHAPFTYKITIDNNGGNRRGTVRIFLAPKVDEKGVNMVLNEQRRLFIEMDRFIVNLKGGKNVVERRSSQSSVTIPFERTFRNLNQNRPAEGTPELELFNFCGCGWPEHMLVPKGSSSGFQAQLFVMVTDYEQDKVQQPNTAPPCSDASSFCGVRDSLYPDRRPMGFPFDRPPPDGVNTINDFLTPNMALQNVTIAHSNKTTLGSQARQSPGTSWN